MKILMSVIFLLAVCGMFVVYPMYFYFLNEFKNLLASNHPDIWNRLVSSNKPSIQAAYRALQLSKHGKIENIQLSVAVLMARKRAIVALYLGVFLFLIVLAIGLAESVSVSKY